MQRLLEGVHRFRTAEFGRYRDLFRRLSREGQKPHTLFITCADSRVLAEVICHDPARLTAECIALVSGLCYPGASMTEIARRHGVPVVEDRPLARALFRIDLDREIPVALYRAVAELLAYVYRLKHRSYPAVRAA
mgnify:CR=1 FL=1